MSDLINKNFTVKTSKNWILPPRPKPGRKPSSYLNVNNLGSMAALSPNLNGSLRLNESNTSDRYRAGSEIPQQEDASKLKSIANSRQIQASSSSATYANNSKQSQKKRKNSEELITLINEINQENSILKNDLIKLIHDFKILKYQSQQSVTMPRTLSSSMDAQLAENEKESHEISSVQSQENPDFKELLSFIQITDDELTTLPKQSTSSTLLNIQSNSHHSQHETDEFESDLETDDSLPSLTSTPSISTNSDVDDHHMQQSLNSFVHRPHSSQQVSHSTVATKKIIKLENYEEKITNNERDKTDKYNYYNDLIEESLIDGNLNYYIGQSQSGCYY